MGITLSHFQLRPALLDENALRQQLLLAQGDRQDAEDGVLDLNTLAAAERERLNPELFTEVRTFSTIARLYTFSDPELRARLEPQIREREAACGELIFFDGSPESLNAEVETLQQSHNWELLSACWRSYPLDEPKYWSRDVFMARDQQGAYYELFWDFGKILAPAFYEALPIELSGRYITDFDFVLKAESAVYEEHKEAYRYFFIDAYRPGRSLYYFHW